MNEKIVDSEKTVGSGECVVESKKPEDYFFRASAADFKKIPSKPIAYWVGKSLRDLYSSHKLAGEVSKAVVGLQTGDNDRFIRFWYEVDNSRISTNLTNTEESKSNSIKWVPYNKGGAYRKWYGNREYVVNWEGDGVEIRNFKDSRGKLRSRPQNTSFYFREAITWSEITSSWKSFRFNSAGSISDVKGQSAFFSDRMLLFKTLAWLNSNITEYLTKVLNPTLSFQSGDYRNIPLPLMDDECGKLAKRAVKISKVDWDASELSFDFKTLPIIRKCSQLSASYIDYRKFCNALFSELIQIEKYLNENLVKSYELQCDVRTDVKSEQITLTCNPHYRYGGDKTAVELEALLLADTMKEFISYAVGCMFGRYSLDKEGLILATQGETLDDYLKQVPEPTFMPDEDGIVPVSDYAWFDDDASNRFFAFVATIWPKEVLDENLDFIAESLKPRRGESARETIRRYISQSFFKDHLKRYKKRPIYWLFSSGRESAFECLVYLHRYNEGTLARMRTEYVIPLSGKLNARVDHLREEAEQAQSSAARNRMLKEFQVMEKKREELRQFDEKLRHYADQRISIDLDDGVKVNYGKFNGLLAEVKAVTGKK